MKTENKGDSIAIYAKNRKEWRKWLEQNHAKEKSTWLIMYNKSSGIPTLTNEEAVEEALCFGWIDSKANKRDSESKYQYFAKRKPNSAWSKINRDRVAKLTKAGLMTPAGKAMIDLAKKTGTWTALEEIDNMFVPPDLQKAFVKNKTALKHFEAFPPSSKKIILLWISTAKRPETRQQRIEQTIALAAKNIRANHYTPKK